jgi:hypothetical protein
MFIIFLRLGYRPMQHKKKDWIHKKQSNWGLQKNHTPKSQILVLRPTHMDFVYYQYIISYEDSYIKH